MQFLIEILIWIGIFLILKKHWHKQIVQQRYIEFIISLNVFACMLYVCIMYIGELAVADGIGKIFLHGIVALIIYTLTRNNKYKIKK